MAQLFPIESNKIVIGNNLFSVPLSQNQSNALREWNSDLGSLKEAKCMFSGCYLLTAFYGNLSSLTDGTEMFNYCENLTTITDTFDQLVIGDMMFNYTKISNIDGNFNNVTSGYAMFAECTNLTSFYSNLSSLTNGYGMFYNCNNLTTFYSDLSSLTDGRYMFYNAKLESFYSDSSGSSVNLSKLTNGYGMFWDCPNLASFSTDLSSLTNGGYMFNNCANLTSFYSNLSSLTDGEYMFSGCYMLTAFYGSLSSLTNAYSMFSNCMLDATSVKNIIESLPQRTSNTSTTIGIGVSSSTVNGKDVAQQLLEFANVVGYDTWADLKQAFVNKKWSVSWIYSGGVGEITLSEDERFRGIPVYTRLIEVENKNKAEYCTEDGTKYYNIEWGHDVTHPEEFEYFGSLLEACGYYGVIPKIYLEEV